MAVTMVMTATVVARPALVMMIMTATTMRVMMVPRMATVMTVPLVVAVLAIAVSMAVRMTTMVSMVPVMAMLVVVAVFRMTATVASMPMTMPMTVTGTLCFLEKLSATFGRLLHHRCGIFSKLCFQSGNHPVEIAFELLGFLFIEITEKQLGHMVAWLLGRAPFFRELCENDALVFLAVNTLDVALVFELGECLIERCHADAHDTGNFLRAETVLDLQQRQDPTLAARRVAERSTLVAHLVAVRARHLLDGVVLLEEFFLRIHLVLLFLLVPVLFSGAILYRYL